MNISIFCEIMTTPSTYLKFGCFKQMECFFFVYYFCENGLRIIPLVMVKRTDVSMVTSLLQIRILLISCSQRPNNILVEVMEDCFGACYSVLPWEFR